MPARLPPEPCVQVIPGSLHGDRTAPESTVGHPDGEIVCLGEGGKPQFYELLRRRTAGCVFYAFDLLWLDGRDTRGLELRDRFLRPPRSHVAEVDAGEHADALLHLR